MAAARQREQGRELRCTPAAVEDVEEVEAPRWGSARPGLEPGPHRLIQACPRQPRQWWQVAWPTTGTCKARWTNGHCSKRPRKACQHIESSSCRQGGSMSCHGSRLDPSGRWSSAGEEDRMAAATTVRRSARRSVGWRWTAGVFVGGGVATGVWSPRGTRLRRRQHLS